MRTWKILYCLGNISQNYYTLHFIILINCSLQIISKIKFAHIMSENFEKYPVRFLRFQEYVFKYPNIFMYYHKRLIKAAYIHILRWNQRLFVILHIKKSEMLINKPINELFQLYFPSLHPPVLLKGYFGHPHSWDWKRVLRCESSMIRASCKHWASSVKVIKMMKSNPQLC